MTESPYSTGVNPPECGRIWGETDGPESAGNALCPALTPEIAEAGMNDSNTRPQAEDQRVTEREGLAIAAVLRYAELLVRTSGQRPEVLACDAAYAIRKAVAPFLLNDNHCDSDTTPVEWAVVYGGPDPDSCAGLQVFDDEAEATEEVQWRVQASLWRREVTRGQWMYVAPRDALAAEHSHL